MFFFFLDGILNLKLFKDLFGLVRCEFQHVSCLFRLQFNHQHSDVTFITSVGIGTTSSVQMHFHLSYHKGHV